MTKNLVTIVNRDGAIELFDIQKIKQSIANAVEQTGVSALELESKLDQFIKTGITTKEIHPAARTLLGGKFAGLDRFVDSFLLDAYQCPDFFGI